jgi:short-subunit dehydrogenase
MVEVNPNNQARKPVIVTGASSGIGKATVIKLLDSGYQVFGLARRFNELRTDFSLCSSTFREEKEELYIPIQFDITKSETYDETIDYIASKAQNKTIYGLVNNAGYVEPGAVEDITMNNLRNQFETNFFGLVGFTKKVLQRMMLRHRNVRAIDGRIVNISSLAGLISLPLIGSYSASKHALEAISDSLRIELWNSRIKIITVNPGVIDTNIYAVLKAKIDDLGRENNINNKSSRFNAAYDKYFTKWNHPGMDPCVVAGVILDAISSPNPKQRYIIGSTKEKLALKLKHIIPDELYFSFVAKQIHR